MITKNVGVCINSMLVKIVGVCINSVCVVSVWSREATMLAFMLTLICYVTLREVWDMSKQSAGVHHISKLCVSLKRNDWCHQNLDLFKLITWRVSFHLMDLPSYNNAKNLHLTHNFWDTVLPLDLITETVWTIASNYKGLSNICRQASIKFIFTYLDKGLNTPCNFKQKYSAKW